MSDVNGTSKAVILARANKRGEVALAVPDDEDRVCLDQEGLVKWMIDKSSPNQGKQQCVVFTLTHDHKVNGNRQITSSRAIKKTSSPGEREEIVRAAVEEFDYEAEETVKHYPDMQRFVVWAYKTEGASGDDRKDDAEFSRSFSVEPFENTKMSMGQAYGDPGSGSVDTVSIISTLTGALQKKDHQNAQNMQGMFERLTEMNLGFVESLKDNLNARMELAERVEKALDDRSRREAEARDQNMKTDALFALFQGGMEFAKSYGARLIAIRERQLGMGVSDDKADAPFIAFAKTLVPEQLLGIVTLLTKDQQRMFAPMADKIVYAMPPEQQEIAGALFGAWKDSLEAEERAAKQAASDPGVKVTEVPKKEQKK